MSGQEVGKTCTQKGWQQGSSELNGWQLSSGRTDRVYVYADLL